MQYTAAYNSKKFIKNAFLKENVWHTIYSDGMKGKRFEGTIYGINGDLRDCG